MCVKKNQVGLVATYQYSGGRVIDVYGSDLCGEDRFTTYDIYENGRCLNEDEIFYNLPSYKSVKKYLKKYNK